MKFTGPHHGLKLELVVSHLGNAPLRATHPEIPPSTPSPACTASAPTVQRSRVTA
jgi:hypothetical protein